jgi:hypothetical protein
VEHPNAPRAGMVSKVAATLYFIVVMVPTLLLLILSPTLFLGNIIQILESGFTTLTSDMAVTMLLGFLIGISALFPALRLMYHKLPCLFPFVKILYINVIIMEVAPLILNYGYEIQDSNRHTIFFVLTILEIIVGRALMCLYFHKKRVEYIGGHANVNS